MDKFNSINDVRQWVVIQTELYFDPSQYEGDFETWEEV